MPGLEYTARFGAAFDHARPDTREAFDRIAARAHRHRHSGVLRLERPGTVLSGLTIRNDYACDRPDAAPPGAGPDAEGRFARGQLQAVALQVAADMTCLRDLRLSSFQDTLDLQAPGRTRVEDGEIEGDVDFVFGGGTAFFERCTFRSRGQRGATSWVFAPSTSLREAHGFVVQGCAFTHDGFETGRTGGSFLGRHGSRAFAPRPTADRRSRATSAGRRTGRPSIRRWARSASARWRLSANARSSTARSGPISRGPGAGTAELRGAGHRVSARRSSRGTSS